MNLKHFNKKNIITFCVIICLIAVFLMIDVPCVKGLYKDMTAPPPSPDDDLQIFSPPVDAFIWLIINAPLFISQVVILLGVYSFIKNKIHGMSKWFVVIAMLLAILIIGFYACVISFLRKNGLG